MLYTGGGHRQFEQFKAFFGGAFFQQRDGFFTVRRVVVNQGDFFALQAAFFFFQDVLNHGIGRRPVVAQQGEVPLKHPAIGRLRQAVARGHDGGLVARGFVANGKGNAGRLGVKAGGAVGAVFHALVALHALAGVVRGFAFFKGDLDTIDPAFGIHQFQVILLAVGPWNAQGGELAGAVHQQRHELLLRLRLGGGAGQQGAQAGSRNGGGHGNGFEFHGGLLKVGKVPGWRHSEVPSLKNVNASKDCAA